MIRGKVADVYRRTHNDRGDGPADRAGRGHAAERDPQGARGHGRPRRRPGTAARRRGRAPDVQHLLLQRRLVPGTAPEAGARQHLHRRHVPGRLLPGAEGHSRHGGPGRRGRRRGASRSSMPAQIELEPNTAFVVAEECCGCKTCIPLCPYTAISRDEEKKVPSSTRRSARAAAPASPPARGSIIQNLFEDEEIFRKSTGS